MAHFAQLDPENIVIQVVVVDNKNILDTQGKEQEYLGLQFCKDLMGDDTVWVQTSYNNNFRANYAGVGMKYDSTRDAFIFIQPYPSWVLDEDTLSWKAPIPDPQAHSDGVPYSWDEESVSWVPYEGVPYEG
jgi:hypothetical protein